MEARTIGIVYIVHDRKIYIATGKNTWKARHIRDNPHVSMTVPLPKRIPFMPWFKIPSATITFSGLGTVLEPEDVGKDLLHALLRGHENVVNSAAFSPDGRYIVTASDDSTARIYLAHIEDLMELARSRVFRDLTPEERRRYLHED